MPAWWTEEDQTLWAMSAIAIELSAIFEESTASVASFELVTEPACSAAVSTALSASSEAPTALAVISA